MNLGSLRHLVARFFDVATARSLSPREQGEAAALLGDQERPMFWGLAAADQRHCLESARRVLRARPGDRATARAALLHDVGKRHASIGPLGRTAATLFELTGRRPPLAGWRAYLDHASLGAGDLEATGAEDLVVAFARHHHGTRPEGVDPLVWEVLVKADEE